MKIAAVISEYNPFHNGHKYLVEEIRKMGFTHVVSIMSGDFVQRGEAAIMSKWERTRSALNSGVDLVFELPVVFSVSRAESFSAGAVFILNSLGVIDNIVFGSECGNLDLLKQVSDFLVSTDFSQMVKVKMKCDRKTKFVNVREDVVCEIFGENISRRLSNPNDILAIEYLKSLSVLGSNIVPLTVKRKFVEHDSLIASDGIASASMIRGLVRKSELEKVKKFMPQESFRVLQNEVKLGNAPSDMLYAQRALISKLRCMDSIEISEIADVSEGLENRIFAAIANSTSLEGLYDMVKTKRYTHARIRRIILSAFLGITKSLESVKPSYVRVLGFNDKGREVLKKSKKTSSIQIITRASDLKNLSDDSNELLKIEKRSENLFSIFTPNIRPMKFNSSIYLKESE